MEAEFWSHWANLLKAMNCARALKFNLKVISFFLLSHTVSLLEVGDKNKIYEVIKMIVDILRNRVLLLEIHTVMEK